MRGMVRSIAYVTMLVTAPAVGGVTSSADAAQKFKGTFTSTQARSCTVASDAFVAPNFAIPAYTFLLRQEASDSETMIFNGDGTGTVTGRSKGMNVSATTPGSGIINVSEFSATFDYAVNPDGTLDVTNLLVTFEVVLGSGIGNTGTTTGQVRHFRITDNGAGLQSVDDQITNEVVQTFPLVGSPSTTNRICTRNLTARRVN